jgi:hypothetical protein
MLRPIILLGTLAIIANSQGRPEPATIKITSPASGVVVHPGQTVDIEVTVSGPYSLVGLSESLGVLVGLGRSLDSPPYRFPVQIPAVIEFQPYTITAQLYDLGGRINSRVASDRITLDVEPSAPPRKFRIREDYYPLRFQVGGGSELYVGGTFAGSDEVNLNRSTLTTYEAEPPGIVSLSWGQVHGLAPGSAKVTARHQGLQASVTVTVVGDELRITSPPEGTVVHPGQELSVDVSASGGPFEGVAVAAFLAQSFSPAATVQPYWFTLTIPLSAPIGPSDIVAMGRVASAPLPIDSLPVSIDIERSDAPQSLFPPYDRFEASTWVGGQEHIQIYGKYPDNPRVDLTRSTLTTYETTSKGIVSIEKDGWITGLAAGSTTVVIRHRNLRIAVKVLVRE